MYDIRTSIIHHLSRYFDWFLDLNREDELEVRREIARIEKENNMPYVTSWERIGREEGLSEGRLEGRLEGLEGMLDIRFGSEGLALMDNIRQRNDSALLERLLKAARNRKTSLDDVRKILAGN